LMERRFKEKVTWNLQATMRNSDQIF